MYVYMLIYALYMIIIIMNSLPSFSSATRPFSPTAKREVYEYVYVYRERCMNMYMFIYMYINVWSMYTYINIYVYKTYGYR
jgi:hypothetical protein